MRKNDTNLGFYSDGWIIDYSTWVYVDRAHFYVVGDVSTRLAIGRKIKYKIGGDWRYNVITKVTYSSPNTYITITCGEYPLSNTTITDNYFSYFESPDGFPEYLKHIYISDSFIKANSTTVVGSPDVGGLPVNYKINSTLNSGSWGISNNRLYCPTSQTENRIFWGAPNRSYTIFARIATKPTDGGIIFRHMEGNVVNDYLLSLSQGAYKLYTYTGVSGGTYTYTQVMDGPVYPVPANSVLIKIVNTPTEIKIYANGSFLYSYQNPLLNSGTLIGFRETGTALAVEDLLVTGIN
jgi:hypothetical protein